MGSHNNNNIMINYEGMTEATKQENKEKEKRKIKNYWRQTPHLPITLSAVTSQY